ncbi:MAG: hypothetical protein V7756_18365 [Halopseudomonas sp.]|uniref:hypothetical protein n=1 Tax=Halopseudomonas sp. TaxID=2901191 RepID=UPI003002EEC2
MTPWMRTGGLLTALTALTGCSDGNEAESTIPAGNNVGFPALPAMPEERVTLNGRMTFWMYEGDGGCFGSISDGMQEVELWVDVETCDQVEYPENAPASVEVTYRPDNQYAPGKLYTIVSFNQPPVMAE